MMTCALLIAFTTTATLSLHAQEPESSRSAEIAQWLALTLRSDGHAAAAEHFPDPADRVITGRDLVSVLRSVDADGVHTSEPLWVSGLAVTGTFELSGVLRHGVMFQDVSFQDHAWIQGLRWEGTSVSFLNCEFGPLGLRVMSNPSGGILNIFNYSSSGDLEFTDSNLELLSVDECASGESLTMDSCEIEQLQAYDIEFARLSVDGSTVGSADLRTIRAHRLEFDGLEVENGLDLGDVRLSMSSGQWPEAGIFLSSVNCLGDLEIRGVGPRDDAVEAPLLWIERSRVGGNLILSNLELGRRKFGHRDLESSLWIDLSEVAGDLLLEGVDTDSRVWLQSVSARFLSARDLHCRQEARMTHVDCEQLIALDWTAPEGISLAHIEARGLTFERIQSGPGAQLRIQTTNSRTASFRSVDSDLLVQDSAISDVMLTDASIPGAPEGAHGAGVARKSHFSNIDVDRLAVVELQSDSLEFEGLRVRDVLELTALRVETRLGITRSNCRSLRLNDLGMAPGAQAEFSSFDFSHATWRDAQGIPDPRTLYRFFRASDSDPKVLSGIARVFKESGNVPLYEDAMIRAQDLARSQKSLIARLFEWFFFKFLFGYGVSYVNPLLFLATLIVMGLFHNSVPYTKRAQWGQLRKMGYRFTYSTATILPFRLPIEDQAVAPNRGFPWIWHNVQVLGGWIVLSLIGLSLGGYFDSVR